MTKLLESALKGDITALFEITIAIQKHTLDKSDEQAIGFNTLNKNDKAYLWMKYLESCLYGFGGTTIGENIEKYIAITKELLAHPNNSVYSWTINLLSGLDRNDKLKGVNISKLQEGLAKAKRTLNPFVLHNEAQQYKPVDKKNINFEMVTKYLELVTPIYQFLPEPWRNEVKNDINLIIPILSKTDNVPIQIYYALGNFYEQNSDKETAKIWFNEASKDNISTTQNWLNILSEQKPKELEEKLKTFIDEVKEYYQELSHELPNPDFIEGEKNTIATLQAEIDHINNYINDLRTIADRKPKFLTKTHEKLMTDLAAAIDELSKHITAREKIVDNLLTLRDENLKLQSQVSQLTEINSELAADLRDAKYKYSASIQTNNTLKEEVKSLQKERAELSQKTAAPSPEKPKEEQTSRMASFFRKK